MHEHIALGLISRVQINKRKLACSQVENAIGEWFFFLLELIVG